MVLSEITGSFFFHQLDSPFERFNTNNSKNDLHNKPISMVSLLFDFFEFFRLESSHQNMYYRPCEQILLLNRYDDDLAITSRLLRFDRFDVGPSCFSRLSKTAHDRIPLWSVRSPPPPRCCGVCWRRSGKNKVETRKFPNRSPCENRARRHDYDVVVNDGVRYLNASRFYRTLTIPMTMYSSPGRSEQQCKTSAPSSVLSVHRNDGALMPGYSVPRWSCKASRFCGKTTTG